MPFESVLITGANRGIGLEFVKQFVAQENGPRHIFACYRDSSKVDELTKIVQTAKSCVKVHLVSLEATNDDQIHGAVKYVESVMGEDGLNLLINNAAMLLRESMMLPNVDRSLLIRHLDVNAASPLIITQAFLPLLRKAAQNHSDEPMSVFHAGVVNISSGAGSISANTSCSALIGYGYPVSKAALNMITKCLSIDLKPDKILVVSVRPGRVKTDMGGPMATVTPEQSISTMLKTFRRFTDEHSGGYFQPDGTPTEF